MRDENIGRIQFDIAERRIVQIIGELVFDAVEPGQIGRDVADSAADIPAEAHIRRIDRLTLHRSIGQGDVVAADRGEGCRRCSREGQGRIRATDEDSGRAAADAGATGDAGADGLAIGFLDIDARGGGAGNGDAADDGVGRVAIGWELRVVVGDVDAVFVVAQRAAADGQARRGVVSGDQHTVGGAGIAVVGNGDAHTAFHRDDFQAEVVGIGPQAGSIDRDAVIGDGSRRSALVHQVVEDAAMVGADRVVLDDQTQTGRIGEVEVVVLIADVDVGDGVVADGAVVIVLEGNTAAAIAAKIVPGGDIVDLVVADHRAGDGRAAVDCVPDNAVAVEILDDVVLDDHRGVHAAGIGVVGADAVVDAGAGVDIDAVEQTSRRGRQRGVVAVDGQAVDGDGNGVGGIAGIAEAEDGSAGIARAAVAGLDVGYGRYDNRFGAARCGVGVDVGVGAEDGQRLGYDDVVDVGAGFDIDGVARRGGVDGALNSAGVIGGRIQVAVGRDEHFAALDADKTKATGVDRIGDAVFDGVGLGQRQRTGRRAAERVAGGVENVAGCQITDELRAGKPVASAVGHSAGAGVDLQISDIDRTGGGVVEIVAGNRAVGGACEFDAGAVVVDAVASDTGRGTGDEDTSGCGINSVSGDRGGAVEGHLNACGQAAERVIAGRDIGGDQVHAGAGTGDGVVFNQCRAARSRNVAGFQRVDSRSTGVGKRDRVAF